MSIMTAMPQGAAVEGINPNLLDNWYFVGGGSQQGGGQFPINQRGATSYSAANYMMDRWVGGAATAQVTINANSIQFSSSTQDSVAYLMQYVEETLVGKTVTISAIIDGQLQVNTGTITAESNLETTNLLLRTPANGKTQFRFKVTSTTGIAVYAAKLELGDQQTLAKNLGTASSPNWVLNEIPNYGIEVLKCETSVADDTDPESSLKAVTNKATFISSARDLNDYKQPGIYWWTNAPTNAPVTSGIGSWLNGWLYVYKSDDGSRIVQEALYNPASTGETSPMVRMYANNNWSPWRTIDRSLNADLVLHVNATSGNDNNNGLTAETALKTINAAFAKIPANVAGRRVIISLAKGTYAAAALGSRNGGTYYINNENNADASSTFVQGLSISSSCAGTSVFISYLTFTGNVTTDYHVLGGFLRVASCTFDNARLVNQGGQCYINSCTFRNISSSAIYGWQSDLFITSATIASTVTSGVVTQGGVITVETITNNATTQYATSQGGRIFVEGRTYKEKPSAEQIYYAATPYSVAGGNKDITLTHPMDQYSEIILYLTTSSSNASSNRSVVRFHPWELGIGAHYVFAINNNINSVRLGFASTGVYTTLRFISTTASELYISQVVGAVGSS